MVLYSTSLGNILLASIKWLERKFDPLCSNPYLAIFRSCSGGRQTVSIKPRDVFKLNWIECIPISYSKFIAWSKFVLIRHIASACETARGDTTLTRFLCYKRSMLKPKNVRLVFFVSVWMLSTGRWKKFSLSRFLTPAPEIYWWDGNSQRVAWSQLRSFDAHWTVAREAACSKSIKTNSVTANYEPQRPRTHRSPAVPTVTSSLVNESRRNKLDLKVLMLKSRWIMRIQYHVCPKSNVIFYISLFMTEQTSVKHVELECDLIAAVYLRSVHAFVSVVYAWKNTDENSSNLGKAACTRFPAR